MDGLIKRMFETGMYSNMGGSEGSGGVRDTGNEVEIVIFYAIVNWQDEIFGLLNKCWLIDGT